MAYPFKDVLDGGLSIEDWFKNLWMRDKNAKSLLDRVEKVMRMYKNNKQYSRDILESMKILRRKLISQANAGGKISPEFIETLDIDFDPAIYDVEPEDEYAPNIDKLVDENHRRYTMGEFNDIYEAMEVQTKTNVDPLQKNLDLKAQQLKKAEIQKIMNDAMKNKKPMTPKEAEKIYADRQAVRTNSTLK